MRLGEIYESIVRKGVEKDPRGKKRIDYLLKKEKDRFNKLPKDEKDLYDKEKLKNPFADTRLLYGNSNKNIKRVMVGIDMEVGEVLLAQKLGEMGKSIDLIFAHHPEGSALAGLYEVMPMQADIMAQYGVPINIAEGILLDRIKQVQTSLLPINHTRGVDVAKIFDIPFLCCHTAADNCVNDYLKKLVEKKKFNEVGDILKFLRTIPEYKEAEKQGAGPRIVVGAKNSRAGKVYVDMTGGTGSPEKAIQTLAQAGVGTIICMHIKEANQKAARKHHVNVIVAGHISSDNIGMNLILDSLQKKGKLEIVPVSGFRRFKRK